MANAFARKFTNVGVTSEGELVAFEVEAKRHRHAKHRIKELFKRCKPGMTIAWKSKQPIEIYKDNTLEDYELYPYLQQAVTIVTDGSHASDVRPPGSTARSKAPEVKPKGGDIQPSLPIPYVAQPKSAPAPAASKPPPLRYIFKEEDIQAVGLYIFKYDKHDHPILQED